MGNRFCLKLFLILAILGFSIGLSFAQQTIVTGKVFDQSSLEPLPFVNVSFKGTTVGSTTDFDGNFKVSIDKPVDSLVISYIGYITVKRKIKTGVSQNLNIPLAQNQVALKEVVIKPGENPAHRILKKIIENKDNNDREELDAYQYEVYNKIEFDINNITEEFQNKRVFKPFKFVFDNIDSSSVNEKPYLPLFITESLSEFYYRKKPRKQREIIKGSKVAGVQNESVSQFTGDMYQNVNIFDNNIVVFSKNFISPISDNGLWYYRYYLVDSTYIDGYKSYQINFIPRRKQELVFSGNMWVADSVFALQRLEMTVPDDANINFVNNFNVVQEYKNVDGHFMLKKDRLIVDFAYKDQTMGVYGRKTTSYDKIIVNKPKDGEFYDTNAENVIVEEGAEERSDEFWADSRHDTLSKNEQSIYKLIDTIQTLPAYRSYLDIVTIAVTGYKQFGKIELGPWFSLYSYNKIEGSRFKLGARTSNDFSKWYEISGYVAYGLKDERIKYSGSVKTFITKKPWQMAGANYKFDYEILGLSSNAYRQDNIFASFLRRNPLTSLTAINHYNLWYEREWFTGFLSRLDLTHREYSPLGDVKYRYFYGSDRRPRFMESIKTSEITLFSRFAYDEKYVSSTFTRVSMGTRYPVVSAQVKFGIKGLLDSDFMYQKASINVNDRIRINPFGYFDYIIEAGKVFGNVPYLLLELHPGNETYAYDSYAFNLMNYFEFASDQYCSFALTQHFDGFFLNKIPLFRKLKWREVGTFRAVIGTIDARNRNNLVFPPTLHSLANKPYMETSAGLENIFKVLRVEAMWRLTYLDNPNISKFGIRATIQLTF